MNRKNLFRFLVPALAIFVALVAVELTCSILQKYGAGPVESYGSFADNIPLSPNELPESLSALPKLHPDGFRWPFEKTRDVATPWVNGDYVWYPPPLFMGYISLLLHGTKTAVDRLKVTTDEYSRRVSPWQSEREATAKYHVVLMGCSVTWGESVADENTLAAQLTKDDPDIATYSLAFSGYSVSELIVRARRSNGLKNIAPKRGVGVYFMFQDHIKRFLQSAFTVGTYRSNGIVATEHAAGVFTFGQSVKVDQPIWYYFSKIWAASHFANLFHLDIPQVDDAAVDQYLRAVKALRAEYRRATSPDNPFVVAILPYRYDVLKLRAGLERAQIPYIDYSRADMALVTEGPPRTEGEGHPSAEFYQKWAVALKRDLQAVLK